MFQESQFLFANVLPFNYVKKKYLRARYRDVDSCHWKL